MAKILFLDDMDMRHDLCDLNHGEKHNICHVRTVRECIKKLQDEEWDTVSLDNDLGFGFDEGQEVAYWLEQNPDRMPHQVIVHSSNPVAVRNIMMAIPKAISSDWWNHETK